MGMLNRLAERFGLERRSAGMPFAPTGFTASGHHVNARAAENLSAVLACVNAVASVLASLPVYVYKTLDNGREEDKRHNVAKLLRSPNQWQSWPDWLEFTIAQTLLRGNSVSIINYDNAGRVTSLTPVPWENVSLTILPSGRVAYDVVRVQGAFGGTGEMRRYLDTEIFHLKDRSDDGILGRSRLSRAAEVLGNALALQDYSGQMWKNAAVPSGVLSTEGKLGAEVFERLKSAFENRFTGTKNAGRVMILENGMKWNTISMSPEDAEVLASRRFSVEEICRLFQVPPPIIQDLSHGTFTNSREAGRWFAQFSLSPWARKIEAEFSRSVFSGETRKSHHIEIDLSGLTRGDTEARWASHKIAVDSGILDPDEVRELEGFNPRKKDAVNV
jgi:HK97 family phage portal protein